MSIPMTPSNPLEDDLKDSESGGEPSEPTHLIWRRLQLSKAKLKGVTEMAALMAGFSVVATVELQIQENTNEFLLTSFAVTTALLVSSTMLSIMICTCILPHVEAVAKLNSLELASQSPHDLLIFYIDLSWVLANTVSIFLFIVDVVLLCWIKFPPVPAICITAIMIPVLILLCFFGVIFYRQTITDKLAVSDRKYQELEEINRRLSRHDRDRRGSVSGKTRKESNASISIV